MRDKQLKPTVAEHPRRILIVDDHEDGRRMLQIMLAARGHFILEAADGIAGLALAQAEHPEIAIIDIGLPGLDGYEVARQLRADPAMQNMSLVALTGYGHEDDRVRALAVGFDVHLIKPIIPEDLEKALLGLETLK